MRFYLFFFFLQVPLSTPPGNLTAGVANLSLGAGSPTIPVMPQIATITAHTEATHMVPGVAAAAYTTSSFPAGDDEL